MGRRYIVAFNSVAATALQDLFEIKGVSTKVLRILEIRVTQSTEVGDAQDEMLLFAFKRGIGNTSGSGGSAPTPGKILTGDAAAAFTAEVNNTTIAVAGGGSLETLFQISENVRNGLHWLPTPELVLEFAPSENFFVTLVGNPADSITLSGYCVVEEIG